MSSLPETHSRRKAKRRTGNVYASAAPQYRANGLLGTLPLPPGQKASPPTGFTGGGRPHPTDEEVANWIAEQPQGNIALRLAEVARDFLVDRDDLPPIYAGNNVDGWESIGIDVDDYDKGDGTKHGADQLAELEAEFGPLPATAISSSRWASHPRSGIRVFLVPQGYRFMSKAAGAIDIIQKRHRFMVVAPSTNPDNGGARYEWRHGTADGTTPLDHYPNVGDPNDVAVLPEAWFVYLSRGGTAETEDPISDLSDDELFDWVRTLHYDDEPCERMRRALAECIEKLESSESSHDKITYAHWRLFNLAAEGHTGVGWALDHFHPAWRDHVLGNRGDIEAASTELNRSALGALDKIQPKFGGYLPEDTCAVDTAKFDCEAWAERETVPDDADEPSWAPVDVRSARRGVGAAPPTVLARSDGACLFYRGKTHSVHGESESGKSWLVQCATAEQLIAGESVLYLDFEDEAGPVAERLILLGVPPEVIDESTKFVYVHPDQPPTTDVERAAFDALLSGTYALAVIDGVTDSMGVFGLSTKDNDDVARWQRTLPKAVARQTGAAVVSVDHVTKDADSRGRFALGGQHKMAGLSGAAYLVEMEQPFAAGQAGRASVRVGKDRPGLVRGLGGRWRKQDRTQHVADLYLDSTDAGRTAWSVDAPNDAGKPTDTDEGKPSQSKKVFRPTWFMEQVSRYWEETDDPAGRTSNKTVTAMCEERKAQGKTAHRQYWRDAIKFLLDEGFAKTETGARESQIHVVVKQYRQIEDPLCDGYSGAAAEGVDGWKRKLSDLSDGGES